MAQCIKCGKEITGEHEQALCTSCGGNSEPVDSGDVNFDPQQAGNSESDLGSGTGGLEPVGTDISPPEKKNEGLSPGCSFVFFSFFVAGLSGLVASLLFLSIIPSPATRYNLPTDLGMNVVWVGWGIAILISLVVSAILIVVRRDFLKQERKIFMFFLIGALLATGFTIVTMVALQNHILQLLLDDEEYLSWKNLATYERTLDPADLQLDTLQSPQYRNHISSYFFSINDPTYLKVHKELLARAKEIVDSRYAPPDPTALLFEPEPIPEERLKHYGFYYKLEKEFRLINDDYQKSFPVFQNLSPDQVKNWRENLKSLCYVIYEEELVGYYMSEEQSRSNNQRAIYNPYSSYSESGGKPAYRTDAKVYVIDLEYGQIMTEYTVKGSMPSSRVGGYNIFAKERGAPPSLEKMQDIYNAFDLPDDPDLP